MTRHYDAVIVGHGPVGATAANLLGRYGMKVAVFEVATSIYNMPRAVHFDAEVMRVFQSTGLAEDILPACARTKGVDFISGDGSTLFGFRTSEGVTRSGWASDYMFYQPELEAALQAGVARFPNVEVYAGCEVTDIREDAGAVDVEVKRLSTDETFTVEAAFVVGCDGARSITRRLAGIELEDLRFDQPWLVIDTMLKRDDVELPEVVQQICDPARPTTFVLSRGNHRRWEFMLMPGDDPEEIIKIERVWELLRPWIGPDDADVVRHVVYTFHAVIAERWRKGRMMIAGDAAHQMPPFLGQGMCAGIRDVANLAWKMDLVLRGEAPGALLDTYQAERSPHVRSIIERAVMAGNIIQTTDPEVAKARDERLRSESRAVEVDQDGPFKMAMPRLGSGVFAAGCETSRTGSLFPQGPCRLDGERERLLDDIIGSRFALVADAATATELGGRGLSGDSGDFVARSGIALIALGRRDAPALPEGWTAALDGSGIVLDWLGEGKAALVRPDRYVFGLASTPDGLSALIAELRRRLGGHG